MVTLTARVHVAVLLIVTVLLGGARSSALDPDDKCLCYFTGNGINIRDKPCGTARGMGYIGESVEPTGETQICYLKDRLRWYRFVEFRYLGRNGWSAQNYLECNCLTPS